MFRAFVAHHQVFRTVYAAGRCCVVMCPLRYFILQSLLVIWWWFGFWVFCRASQKIGWNGVIPMDAWQRSGTYRCGVSNIVMFGCWYPDEGTHLFARYINTFHWDMWYMHWWSLFCSLYRCSYTWLCTHTGRLYPLLISVRDRVDPGIIAWSEGLTFRPPSPATLFCQRTGRSCGSSVSQISRDGVGF
jgi:hypothetical protein